MTRIELTDKYFVTKPDPRNWVLVSLCIQKDGKHREKNLFYYPTLMQALQDAVCIIAEDKSISTINEYIDSLRDAYYEVENALKKHLQKHTTENDL